jgi:hypothetical protein
MLDPKMQEGFSKKISTRHSSPKSEESASDLPAPSLSRSGSKTVFTCGKIGEP